jgi:transposase-like protein
MTTTVQNEDDLLPGDNAAAEAKGLLALLQTGETVTSLRNLIGSNTPYRRRVLTLFDLLVAHYPKNGFRLRERVNTKDVSNVLRSEALRLLRSGLSHKAVLERLPIGAGLVVQLSKTYRIAYQKTGRGRRLSPDLKQQIADRVKAGARSSDISKEFGVDYDTTVQFRHLAGDFENRRLRKKLSEHDLAQARTQLEAGGKWRTVAAKLNVSLATLQKSLPYRKNDAGHPVQEMVSAFRAGKQIIEIAGEFRLCVKTVRGLLRRAGVKAEGTGRRFSPEEKEAILTAIRAGTPNREIAAEFHCHRSRVWQMGAARILRSANATN